MGDEGGLGLGIRVGLGLGIGIRVVVMSLPLQIVLPAKWALKYSILGCFLATGAL